MIRRCYNPDDKSYIYYGGKGVRVCDDWLNDHSKFEDWAISNGYSDSLTIDRIDSAQNYSPDNCRWISGEDNKRFKSTTNYIEIDGVTLSGRQWSQYLSLGINNINRMLRDKGLEYTQNHIKERLENIIKRYLQQLTRVNGECVLERMGSNPMKYLVFLQIK